LTAAHFGLRAGIGCRVAALHGFTFSLQAVSIRVEAAFSFAGPANAPFIFLIHAT